MTHYCHFAFLRPVARRSPASRINARGVYRRDSRFRKLNLEPLEHRWVLATFMVINTQNAGAGSLRQAILDANTAGGPDRIEFAIPPTDVGHVYYRDDHVAGAVSLGNITPTSAANDATLADIDPDWPHSWWNISPTSALPSITGTVTLDGYSQAGSVENSRPVGQGLNTILRLQLAGGMAGPTAIGLQLTGASSGSALRGLALNQFGGHTIVLSSDNNVLEGTFIGTDISGHSRATGSNRVHVTGDGNRIGGTDPASRNVISAGLDNGLVVLAAANTVIQGNLIGTNAAGTLDLGSVGNGVLVQDSPNTLIGGTDPGAGNLISGHGTNGITMILAPTTGTVIQGNRIGTDVTGTMPLGNGFFGVFSFGAPNITIGGSAPGAGNLISGNVEHGIFLQEAAHGSSILGNLVGTDRTGTLPLGNGRAGIWVENASNVTIGGSAEGQSNVIGANGFTLGDYALYVHRATNATIVGNYVGTDRTRQHELGNFRGIWLTTGNSVVRENTVAYNGSGIFVGSSGFGNISTGTLISRNSIYANTEFIGIDLLGQIGPEIPQDPTDADTGVNNLQNFPVLTSVDTSGGMTRVTGSLTSAQNATYRIEFFASSVAGPSGYGPGEFYLGSTDVSIGSTSNTVNFQAELPLVSEQFAFITATATDITDTGSGPRNNTSEFSSAALIDNVLTVTNTNDSGPGSLRLAIESANSFPSEGVVAFDIPPTDPNHVYYRDDGIAGSVSLERIAATTAANDATIADIDPDWPHSWWTIEMSSRVTVTSPILVDGYSQQGAIPNTNPVGQGLNSVLRIEITAEPAGELEPLASGLIHINANGATIRGLVMNRIGGQKIQLKSGSNNAIEGNYLGTDVSGTLPLGEGSLLSFEGRYAAVATGIFSSDMPTHNIVGGTSPAARNLLSGNSAGVVLFSEGDDTTVQGNLIGTDRSGTRALGNITGVVVDALHSLVGGSEEGAANVISGNRERGIRLEISDGLNESAIIGNFIGTDVFGTGPLGNGGAGISSAVSNLTISQNTIAFNNPGIAIGSGTGNRISANSIHSNDVLGIDVGDFNVTQNDVPPDSVPPDQDQGANNLQNFPVLTSAKAQGDSIEIEGTLSSTPNSMFRIEFFSNLERDGGIFDFRQNFKAGEFSQGQTYLGFVNVTTDATGEAEFVATVPRRAANEDFLTATATDITDDGSGPRNNSSEFSRVLPIGGESTIVTHTGDIGVGTLREALFVAHVRPGFDAVTFQIPPTDPGHVYYRNDGIAGSVSRNQIATTTAVNDASIADIDPDWPHSWYVIRPLAPLPGVQEQTDINAFTQAGSRTNTLVAPNGLDAVLKIELDGSLVGGNGLSLDRGGDGSIIRGFVINRFGADGIYVDHARGGSQIVGNYVGTDVSGTIGLGNGRSGVFLGTGLAIRVGGFRPEDRNLLSANHRHGLESFGTGGDIYEGNLVGVDRTGARPLGNDLYGILLTGNLGTSFASVGGIGAQHANVVMANGVGGIGVASPAFSSAIPSNPFMHLQPCKSLLTAAYNVRERYFETRSLDDLDELALAIEEFIGCTIDVGQVLLGAQANNILGNYIGYVPHGISVGIDLGINGPTSNDGDNLVTSVIDPDFDRGPNNYQNYPVLGCATTFDETTHIGGQLISYPNSDFRIEFFASAASNAMSYRAGERYLGAIDVHTDVTGTANFHFALPAGLDVNELITATASIQLDLDDDPTTPLIPLETSEFSAPVRVSLDVPGDANGDSLVDATDFAAGNTNRFQNGTNRQTGDFNCDGTTDGSDFNLWNAHKFTTVAPSEPIAAGYTPRHTPRAARPSDEKEVCVDIAMSHSAKLRGDSRLYVARHADNPWHSDVARRQSQAHQSQAHSLRLYAPIVGSRCDGKLADAVFSDLTTIAGEQEGFRDRIGG